MNTKTQNQKHKIQDKRVVYFCDNCETIGKVYAVCWTSRSYGPYKVIVYQLANSGEKQIDEIIIRKKPNGKEMKYFHCGVCGQLVGKSIDIDYLKILEGFQINQPGD